MALLSLDPSTQNTTQPTVIMMESPQKSYGSTEALSQDSKVTHRANARSTSPPTSGDEDTASSFAKEELLTKSKEVALTLLERYRSATSTKMYDVEELVDYYFHRRLAAFIAVVVSYLPFVITPNQITLFGLVLGWGSATCLYDSEFHTPLRWDPNHSLAMAGTLMFLWIVSDCADGQVARLCKRGTRTGRILDGFVDGLVIAPNCGVLGLMCANRYEEQSYIILCIVAGVSLWAHAIVYDKIKNVYMENALPQSECDGETVESVRAEYLAAKAKSSFALDSILLGIYVIYLTAQAKFTSDAETKAEAARHTLLVECNQEYHAHFITRYSGLVRMASFMGISAHVSGLYVAYFSAIYYWDALYYVQLYFAVVLNIVLVATLTMYSKSGMGTASPNKNGSISTK